MLPVANLRFLHPCHYFHLCIHFLIHHPAACFWQMEKQGGKWIVPEYPCLLTTFFFADKAFDNLMKGLREDEQIATGPSMCFTLREAFLFSNRLDRCFFIKFKIHITLTPK
jgi:hypothetical protein